MYVYKLWRYLNVKVMLSIARQQELLYNKYSFIHILEIFLFQRTMRVKNV